MKLGTTRAITRRLSTIIASLTGDLAIVTPKITHKSRISKNNIVILQYLMDKKKKRIEFYDNLDHIYFAVAIRKESRSTDLIAIERKLQNE